MKLTFLGSGSAFCLDNFQSNMLLEKNGKKLLIDCGGDIRISLKEQKLTSNDIDAIYISHIHADHCGGMEYMGFTTHFNPDKSRPILFGESSILQDIWEILGGLRTLGKEMKLDDYFDVRCAKNGLFTWENIKFQLVQVCHCMNGYNLLPSYGLMFNGDKGKKIFITTDTQFNMNQLYGFYDEADIIFQDCETSFYRSGVHAHYTELCIVPEENKRKMRLYHYQDDNKPDCKKDGFSSWCKKGETFEL